MDDGSDSSSLSVGDQTEGLRRGSEDDMGMVTDSSLEISVEGSLESSSLESASLEGPLLEGGFLEGDFLEGGFLEGGLLEGGSPVIDLLEGDMLEGDLLKDDPLEGGMVGSGILDGGELGCTELEIGRSGEMLDSDDNIDEDTDGGRWMSAGSNSSPTSLEGVEGIVGMTEGALILSRSSGILLQSSAVTYSVECSECSEGHNSAVTYSVEQTSAVS